MNYRKISTEILIWRTDSCYFYYLTDSCYFYYLTDSCYFYYFYFRCRHKSKKGAKDFEDASNMPFYSPYCPQQSNEWDCGIYVLGAFLHSDEDKVCVYVKVHKSGVSRKLSGNKGVIALTQRAWVCYVLGCVIFLSTSPCLLFTSVLSPPCMFRCTIVNQPLMHTHPHIAEYLERMCGPGLDQGYDRPEPTLEVCACVCLYVLACAYESAVQNGVHK